MNNKLIILGIKGEQGILIRILVNRLKIGVSHIYLIVIFKKLYILGWNEMFIMAGSNSFVFQTKIIYNLKNIRA